MSLLPFADDRSIYRIIRAVQQAPSVLNTQPWSFRVQADDRIDLRANLGEPHGGGYSRWLHFSDPQARELVISCGAALFNLRMAIRTTGHDVAVWLLPDPDNDPHLLASVEVVTGRTLAATHEEQELYDAIPRRHTYRWPFTGKRVHANILTGLERTAAREHAWLRALYPFQGNDWVHAAAHAEQELSCDRGYVAELRQWTSGAEHGVGVPASAYGPQTLARYAPIRDFNCSWRDGRPLAHFESQPQLMSLATDDDRPLDWLRAGQALQRALLTATRYGVAASFLTQSLEYADHRGLRRSPNPRTFAEVPQMIIRVGYPARPGQVTPREWVPDVLDLRGHSPRRVLPPSPDPADPALTSRWQHRGRLPA